MTKLETITVEIGHCGECSNACLVYGKSYKYKCELVSKVIEDIWGKIPKFCPLPDKEEK